MSTSMCIRLLLFFGCGLMFRFSDCLTVSADYGPNKSDVEFRCVISPYTGSQKWYIDSVEVSVCAAISCMNEPTNPNRYSFEQNITTGIFIFKISSINAADDEREVTCYDGTANQSLSIDLSVTSEGNGDSTLSTGAIVGIVIGCAVGLCVIGLVCAGIISLFYLLYKLKVEDEVLTKCRKEHQNIAGIDKMCCETWCAAYCLSHKLYLCLKCLHKEHNVETCVLLWVTDDKDRKDYNQCSHNKDDLSLKPMCQSCKLFICSQCIEEHEHTGCTSDRQVNDQFNTKTGECCTATETVNFCKTCKKFICASCKKNHHGTHIVIRSLTDFSDSMDNNATLCCKQNMETKGTNTDDFCIQCKTFICATCLKPPHYHILISKLKDNLMYCKRCQTAENNNPVECYDLENDELKCSNCYISNSTDASEKISYPTIITEKMKTFTHTDNKCELHKDLHTKVLSPTATVYCLVCKIFMCKTCFKSSTQKP